MPHVGPHAGMQVMGATMHRVCVAVLTSHCRPHLNPELGDAVWRGPEGTEVAWDGRVAKVVYEFAERRGVGVIGAEEQHVRGEALPGWHAAGSMIHLGQ